MNGGLAVITIGPTGRAGTWPVELAYGRPENLSRSKGTMTLAVAGLAAVAHDEEAYGQLLGRSVFADRAIREALIAARAAYTPLRIRIEVDAPELRSLRWDLLAVPSGDAWKLAVRSPGLTVSRKVDSSVDVRPAASRRRLTLALTLATSNPRFTEPGRVEFDVAKLVEEAGLAPTVHLGSTHDPSCTLDEIRNAMSGCDMFVLVAHGRLAPPAAIYLCDDGRQSQVTTLDELIEVLGTVQLPRLMILVVCGVGAARDSLDIGSQLVERLGVSAVVAMNERFTVESAPVWLGTLVEVLSRTLDIETAVAAARQAIASNEDALVPVLTLRYDGLGLFDSEHDLHDAASARAVVARPSAHPVRAPDFLLEKLRTAPDLHRAFEETSSRLISRIDIEPPFFPDLRDRGPTHITSTLAAAVALIPEEARAIFNAHDAWVLVGAVLLNDLALHLDRSAVRALLQSRTTPSTLHRDEPSWAALWREFLSEARRFDGRQLRRIFGKLQQTPSFELASTSEAEFRLTGEFLRLHRARLAHELASSGMPGTREPCITGIDAELRDVTGFVARSIASPFRQVINALPRPHLRAFRDVHVPFLMALLRVASYLHVGPARGANDALQFKSLRIPFTLSHRLGALPGHFVGAETDDPEALFVEARPANAREYVRMKSVLSSLQAEIDASWAVLGEVYGRHSAYRDIGLTVRRVFSNLDDEATFARTVTFLPSGATFATADTGVLKVLVAPLYGGDPIFGVRELLQNAVDACHELDDWLRNGGDPDAVPPRSEQRPDVTVSLEERGGEWWFEIDDRGIGMTPEVVRDYFLKAGASFRNSDAWRALHTKDGRARVLRSGRFGVGALAAFVLGERIEVSTRHASMDEGVAFECGIDDDLIELHRCPRPVGTTIRIHTRKGAAAALYKNTTSWDWYSLPRPRVIRRLGSSALPQERTFPEPGADLPHTWRRITHDEFAEVHWSYWLGSRDPRLTCNGIVISDRPSDPPLVMPRPRVGFRLPSLSVFDRDGRLALDLVRTRMAGELPFADALWSAVLKDFVAYALVNAPRHPGDGGPLSYVGFQPTGPVSAPWYLHPGGTSLCELRFLQQNAPRALMLTNMPPHWRSRFGIDSTHLIELRLDETNTDSYETALTICADGNYLPLGKMPCTRRRVLVHERSHDFWAFAKWLPEWHLKGWTLLRSAQCPPSAIDFEAIVLQLEASLWRNLVVAEWYPSWEEQEQVFALSERGRVWAELLNGATIPYNLEARWNQNPDLDLAELGENIRAHIELRGMKSGH